MNIKIENLILNLEKGIEILKENKIGGKCSGVPQVAFAMKTESNEIVGSPFVNSSGKCKEKWMKSKYDTHAEAKVLKYIKDHNDISNIPRLTLVVSSHPCKMCIKLISDYEDIIDNVYYISKSSYISKVDEYNELAKEEGYKTFNEINVNFQHFNNFENEEIASLEKYYLSRLNDYLIFNLGRFTEFLESKSRDDKSIITKDEYRNWAYYFELCEKAMGTKVFTVQKEQVKIKYKKIEENIEEIIQYMRIKE